jgi:hypothetical protein
MSIQLKLQHAEGLRLRQQTAREIEKDGAKVKEWKFDQLTDYEGRPCDEVDQDRDPRLVDGAGKKIKLGKYTVHITAGTRNLVVERKGKVTSLDFKNEAIRNQMRVRYQELKETARKTKDGKVVHEWKDSPGNPIFIPPNTWGGAFIGDGQRAILDEMPT